MCSTSSMWSSLYGAVVQFGGQTAIKLTKAAARRGVPILGTARRGHRRARRTGRSSTSCWNSLRHSASRRARRCSPPKKRSKPPTSWATLCWCAPPMCWAARAWRLPATTRTSREYHGHHPDRRARNIPILVDKYLDGQGVRGGRRLRRQGRPRFPASWSISSGPASTRATPSRCIPRSTADPRISVKDDRYTPVELAHALHVESA